LAEVEDHVLLILSIKKAGKFFDGGHICEKVSRDAGVSDEEVRSVLSRLVDAGMVEERNGAFRILPRGIERLEERLNHVWNELNRSYRAVYLARKYYPRVAKLMMPYLEGRAVSVVKVFSDEKDPINSLNPSFVRYARYKPRKQPIVIRSEGDLLDLVDLHAVDFLPVIHRFEERRPDWLVFDVSAGKMFGDKLEPVKVVCRLACECLEEYGVKPAVKFSGSRELQVWARLGEHGLPEGYKDYFSLYKDIVAFIQKKVEEKIQDMPRDEKEVFYRVTRRGKPVTTTQVAKKAERADQILIDPSPLKPNGTVRAPYSIHYETWLTSYPIRNLDEFTPDAATVENVLRETPVFELKESHAEQILEAIKKEG